MEQNTQPAPQTPPPPKKQSGILTGTLLFLLGILIGLALDKTMLLSNIRIPYLSATPTPFTSPKPTAEAGDPTTGWKTYTNQKLGFTVKYPSNLFFKEIDPNYGIVLAFEPFSNSEAPGAYFDSIGVQSDSNALFAFNILQQAIEGKTDIDIHQPCGVMVTKLVNKKFGVYDGVEYIYDGSNPPNGCGRGLIGYEHTILIRKSDSMFIKLVNGSIKPENTRQHDIVFDQILSTFKFTDQTTIDTSKWKTHTKGQLSFRYPADWTVAEQPDQATVLTGPQDGRISISWNDKTNNKPCISDAQTVAEKIIIDAQIGKTGYCVRRLVTEAETISTAAEGPVPEALSSVKIDATTGSGHSPNFSTIEATIKQILSTFKFTQ